MYHAHDTYFMILIYLNNYKNIMFLHAYDIKIMYLMIYSLLFYLLLFDLIIDLYLVIILNRMNRSH